MAEKTNLVVAVSGKGGTGKTTMTMLMVRLLSEVTDRDSVDCRR